MRLLRYKIVVTCCEAGKQEEVGLLNLDVHLTARVWTWTETNIPQQEMNHPLWYVAVCSWRRAVLDKGIKYVLWVPTGEFTLEGGGW